MKKQLGPYKIEEFYWKQQQEKSIVENIRIQGSSVSNKCSYSKKKCLGREECINTFERGTGWMISWK